MATTKKDYICQYCRKPISGYQTWKRHERECPLNPVNTSEDNLPAAAPVTLVPAAETPAAETPAGPGAEPVPMPASEPVAKPAPELVSEPLPAPEPEPEPVPENYDPIGLEVARQLMVFEQRFVELENTIKGEFSGVLDSWRTEMAKLPEIIDSSVANFMVSKGVGPPAPAPEVPDNGQQSVLPPEVPAGPLLVPVPGAPVAPVARQPSGGFLDKILSQIDFGQIATQLIARQGGGNINTALVNILMGKAKTSEPAAATFISRGYSQAQSALRMKGVDKTAMAHNMKESAELMLGSRLSSSERGRQIGIKSFVDTFLAGFTDSDPIEPSQDSPIPPALPAQEA